MSDLEDALRSALRRKDPPVGFAGRVAEKVARSETLRPAAVGSGTAWRWRWTGRGWWWSSAWYTGAVAAGMVVLFAGSAVYQQWREERAGRQAIVALQIASEKLNLARDRALRWEAGASGGFPPDGGCHAEGTRMKRALLWTAMACLGEVAAQAQGQSGPRFQIGLDQLASKAKETVDITLDGATLQMAGKFLAAGKADDDKFKKMVTSLKAISVKSFEFAQEGQYRTEDLDAVRAQLKAPGWSKILGDRSDKESSEIYAKSDGVSITGFAILSAEPKELTVVYIEGAIDLADLAQLGGRFGIPPGVVPDGGGKGKGKKKSPRENK